MRSHGHGQGYTDLNFIIPETIQNIKYKKKPYYADVGDFSGVGSADFSTSNTLDEGTLELTIGQYDYYRLLSTDSYSSAGGVCPESISLCDQRRIKYFGQMLFAVSLVLDMTITISVSMALLTVMPKGLT